MNYLWWLTSIFASVVFAMYIFANQVFKLKGSLVMIYRGIGTALVLLPFAFFITPIDSVVFYILCVFQGLLIAYFDNRLFNASKRYGAEMTGTIQPISVFFGLIMWFIIKPETFMALIESPVRFVLTVAAVIGVILSVLSFKKSRINQLAFLYLLPSMLSVTVIDLVCKILMELGSENVWSAIFYYSLITSFIAGIINAMAFYRGEHSIKEVLLPRNIKCAGISVVTIIVAMYLLKNYSLYLGQNPAYVMAIIYAYPVW
ncbi:MAG: hypothetical protein MJ210_05335, partial [Alphaproteobacteria bacterium]|nr:hypothetical protein [Alphaproteobacteria bacterium]